VTIAALQHHPVSLAEASFYDLLPVGHHSVNGAGVFTQMNELELQWLGYTREEVIGKLTVADVFSEASRAQFKRNFPLLMQHGRLHDLEYEFVRKDGSRFAALVNALAIKDERGRFLGGRAVVVDISARKRMENTLRESERRLEQAQRIANFGYYEINLARQATEVVNGASPRIYEILGLDPRQGPISFEQFFEQCVHPEDRARVRQLCGQATRDGTTFGCEYRVLHTDGSVRYARDEAEPIRGAGGEIERYFGVMHDVTEAKRAQQALLEKERRFRHLVENSHDGVVLLARDATILYASPAALRLLGCSAEEMVGRLPSDFVHPDDLSGVMSALNQLALSPGLQLTFRTRARRADGEWRWFDTANSSRVHDPELGAIICNFHDITDEVVAREAVEATNRKLRQLSQHLQRVREDERTHLARELHDELGAALGTINLYLDHGANDKRGAAQALAQVRALVDTAIDTTRRITTDLRPSVLDHRGLWAALEWLARSVGSGIACRVELDTVREVKLGAATDTAVFRIVQEALRNAVRHAAASEVRVYAEREDGHLVVSVADNGRGIAKGDCSKADSWGIVGMRERAHALGAQLHVGRRAEGGTLVQLRVALA
jgi:PAS domain S-box-containing protein